MNDRNSYKKWTRLEDELLRELMLANIAPFDMPQSLDDRYLLLRRGLIVLE
jgi:hypothetical protein